MSCSLHFQMWCNFKLQEILDRRAKACVVQKIDYCTILYKINEILIDTRLRDIKETSLIFILERVPKNQTSNR